MTESALIIGLGQIGMGYDVGLSEDDYILSHARAFSLNPAFRLVGGVDSCKERRDSFQELFHCPSFESVASALLELSPSIVVIATPSETHAVILKDIFVVMNPKVILCEKPLAYSLDDARDMLNLCKLNGSQLFVNYMRRSEPSVIKVKEMIDEGHIKPPIKAFVWYSKGLLNNGSHFLNLLEYWLGDVIGHKCFDMGRSWDGFDPEPDFQVTFDSGSAVFCSAWEESFSHYTIEMLSPSGRLYYSHGGEKVSWESVEVSDLNTSCKVLKNKSKEIPNSLDYYQANVLTNLWLAINGKKHNLSTGEDALKTLNNIYQITNGLKL